MARKNDYFPKNTGTGADSANASLASSRMPRKEVREIFRSHDFWISLTAIFLACLILTISSWPIYGKSTMFIAAGGAFVTGIILGIAYGIWNITWWKSIIVGYIVYVVMALVTAVPWIYPSFPFALLDGLRQVATGPVTSWKSLLTIALPVGDFGDTQLPLFIVIYLASIISIFVAFRKDKNWAYGLIPLAIALLFPTLFGPATSSQPLSIGPFTLYASVHQLAGLAGMAVLLGWAIIKTRSERKRQMLATQVSSSTTSSHQERKAKVRQSLSALLMALCALLLAVGATIPFASQARSVPRNAIEHRVDAPELSNPLASYRNNFTSNSLDTPLLYLKGDMPSRVRFAALSSYDGLAFRPSSTAEERQQLTDFERVPYRVGNTSGALHETTVTVQGYSGQWVPIASEFSQVEFTGKDTLALREGFYFNIDVQTAIDTIQRNDDSGLRQGDVYTLTYADSDIAEASTKGVSTMTPYVKSATEPPSEDDFPSLNRWLAAQNADTATVSEVVRLRDLLLQRSYLGRSKSQPDGQVTWMPSGYIFRPSDSGQTIERIDTLFANMLDPKYRNCTSPDDQCAAHVGDEEQYAAATALIARSLGFPSRIVYGAHVSKNGTVTGRDMTVWTEIQVADSSWVALDIAPRTDNAFVEQPDTEAYRQYNPNTGQENAPTLDPPAKDPSTSDEQTPQDDELFDTSLWLTYLVRGLEGIGILLLITSPMWGILLAKFIRRRRRRKQGSPNKRIIGGWQEYVDHLVDSGQEIPTHYTRKEIALDRSENARALASSADFAAFSGSLNTPEREAELYWNQVLEECKNDVREQKKTRRLRTYLSPKSFARYRSKKKKDAQDSQSRFHMRIGTKKVEQ